MPDYMHWFVVVDPLQRDVHFVSVINNMHHPSHTEATWMAQKTALLQMGWLRSEPAKNEPFGKINREFTMGHGLNTVVARQKPRDRGFALRTPEL